MLKRHKLSAVIALATGMSLLPLASMADEKDKDKYQEITFIHTGDFHGDLIPHDNLRAGSSASEGGLRVHQLPKVVWRVWPLL